MSTRLHVVFISGPRLSGKSTLIRLLARELCGQPPHYLRLVPVGGGGPRLTLLGDLKGAGLASWKRINYDAERIFEFLPECLAEVAGRGGSRTVLIEADADPTLRYAFPYDHRIFVMAAPRYVHKVFRTPTEAAQALREVMDDTAAFASEMFGLFDPDADEDEGVSVQHIHQRGAVTEERLEITAVQLRRFMNSPLGAEVASRIQLQPDYHSLMESDLILVNAGTGGSQRAVELVVRQIQTLIRRLGDGRMSRPILFQCDPLDASTLARDQLVRHLRALLGE